MDQIKIRDLEVFCNHGVFQEEKILGQKFLVSATLFTDTRKAGMEDDLSYSIHYGEVSHVISDFMKKDTFQLIETVAEQLAKKLLMETPHLERIQLEIKKPWAPVGLPLEYVAVEITRGWHEAYLALGSNLGDRKSYLNRAVEALQNAEGCEVLQVSDYIETAPYGGVEQDPFLNGALKLRTLLPAEELLDLIGQIEAEAKRERTIHWGPRTLDLDLLFYDDDIISTERLIVPHVELQKRDFVLRPLMQLCPYKRHPVFGKTVMEMWKEQAC